MGLRKFFNRQVNIRFIKASSAVLITALFVILLSFSVKIFNSFADTVTPVGDVLYSEVISGSTYEYYKNCIVKNGSVISSVIDQYDITDTANSSAESCMAYLYGDGMLVLDGEGYVNEYYDSYYKHTTHRDNVNKAATSVNGFKPSSCKFLFQGLRNLESVDLATLDCTNVSSYEQMFNGCTKLKSVSFPDSQSTKITSLYCMFNGCTKLESVNLQNLNETTVDYAIQMFNGCESLKNITFPAVKFDTTNPQMTWMFGNCESLDSVIFAEGIDTTAITNVAMMFNGCKKLKSIDLSSWKFDNVTDGNDLFYNANAIEKVILPESVPTTGDIPLPSSAKWVIYDKDDNVINSDPTKVVSYTTKGDYISNVVLLYTYTDPDSGKVTKYYTNGHKVNNGELVPCKASSSLNGANNKLMYYLYQDGMLVLSGKGSRNTCGDTAEFRDDAYRNSITKVASANSGCIFESGSTACVLFKNLTNLQYADLQTMDISNVVATSYMFDGCSNLKTLLLGENFKIDNAKSAYYMFKKCSSLEKLDLSIFTKTASTTSDNSGYINFCGMFAHCTSLTELNLENLVTVPNTDFDYMFGETSETGLQYPPLTKLNIKSMDLSGVRSSSHAFTLVGDGTKQMNELNEIVLPTKVSSTYNIALPTHEGYVWMGYKGEIQVSSKTYTYLPAREGGVVDTIRLVEEPPIYTDDLGTTDTSDDIKYYKSRTNKTSGTDKIDFVKQYDISKETDGSLMAYLYSNGMLILDGTGNLFETNYSASTKVLMPYASDTANKSKITKVAFSDLGFTPDTCKGLFATLNNLSSIYNISKLNATSITDYSYMFSDCTSLTNVDLSSLNFNNITDMSYMFSNCTSMVKNITWPSCVFANDVNMSHLFDGCSLLEEVDLSTFNMSNVTDDNHVIDVFKGCTKINKIILPIATRRYDQTGVIDLPDPLHFNKYEANGTKYDDHVYLEILGRTNEGDYLGKDKNTLLFTDTKGTPETTDDDVKYYLYGDEGTGILVDSVKEFCLDGNTVAIHYNDGMLILQGEGNINAGDYNCIVPSTSIMNSFKANTTKAACSNLRFIPDSLGKLFYGYDELESFDATNLDCTNVKSYQQMFDGCTLLKSAIFPNSQSTNKTKIYAMFNECKALENVDLKNLNGTTVTDAQEMFYNCDKLTSITFPSVTFGNDGTNARLSQAFNSCDLLESVTFADGINTEYVTDIRFMCDNCPKLEYVDFSNCDFSGLTTKYEIFRNSTAIEKVILPSAVPSSSSYDIPLPSSDTWVVFKGDGSVRDGSKQTKVVSYTNKGDYISNVILLYTYTDTVTLEVTKYYANGHKVNDGELVPCTAYDITDTNRSSAGSCMAYYYNDGMLIFDGEGENKADYTPWNSEGKTVNHVAISDFGFKPTTLCETFSGLTNSNCTTIYQLDKLDTSNVTSMAKMFKDSSALTSIDLSHFVTGKEDDSDTNYVTNMSNMFYGCRNLTSLVLSSFDTSHVIDMNSMFQECNGLESITFGTNFDTSNVTNMARIFSNCCNLTSINVSNFDTSKVTDMRNMFSLCEKLSSLNLNNFVTGKENDDDSYYVTRMDGMFNGCETLTTLTLGNNFKTDYVTDMGEMFENCKALTNIDVSKFNTSNVTNMFKMFYGCSGLQSLTLKIDDSNLTTAKDALDGCINVNTLDLTGSSLQKNITNHLYIPSLSNVEKIILPQVVSDTCNISLPNGATWVVFKADGTIRDTTPKTKLLACTETGDYISKGIPISSCTFTAPTNLVYDGNAQTFTLDIKNGSTPLVLDTDYEIVEWGNNTNAGLSTDTNAPYVKVKGKGTYVGEATYKFDIAKYDLEVDLNDATSNAVLNVTDTKTYDGDNKAKLSNSDTFSINYPTGVVVSSNEQTIKINLKGTFNSKDVDATKVTYEITSLSDGDNGGLITNYNVTYKDNVSVNDNKFERVGTITPFEITMSWPTSLQVSKSYDGDNKVKFDDGSGNLTETKPHSFTGVNSETVHVLISGTYTSGSASGSDLSYTLSAMLDTSDTYKAVNKNYVLSDISKTKNGNDGVISALSFNDGTRFNITNNFVTPIEYDGQIHKVSISDFVITLDGTELDNISDDFEIVFDSDSYNYIDAGTYNYKLKAKETGKYSGEIPFSYTITPKVINVTDIVLEPYSSTNLLTKEYDGNKDFVIKEGMITPSLKYHFNDDVTLTLNYSKGEYSDSNKDNTIAIKKDNGGNASTKDLVFSTITLDSSSNTGINLNNFVLNSSDDFSSITFSNCGQILDTISPVITDVSFDKTTIGKNGTLEITLTFSEDLVHDFSSIDNEELNNKFYIELNSLLGVTPSVNYGKAYIDLVKMPSCDHNKLIFKYLLPSEYNDGYLVEGLSGAIHKDNINVSDDCDNQIDTAFSSDLQTNKFGTLVINTQGIVVNIKAYSDSTYDESKLLDTSKNTDLLTIYYEFIFEDSVNDFDESDIKVKINGMDKEITSGLTKVDNKVYRIAISNAGYLSVDDTDGIISMIVSLEKGCAHDANGNDTISQSLALNVERNLIIKDETVLQDIPGVTNKVFAKVADYTSKLSYKVFKYFDSLMQESDEVKASDGLLITTHEVTNNGIKLVLDVTAKLNEYKTKVTQFSYVVKTNDHIAKEIINNVIPTSDSTKDGNIKNIILDPDNEEILKLDSDVKTIINNPSNTDVHDAIVEALKDLIEKEDVHGLNDSEKIKDKLKDVISDIARLVDPSNTYGLNFIIDESKNPEERMICYQKLTAIQKEYLDKHYRIDIDKLYIAYKDYVTFSDTKENETIEKFDDTEEIEIYGVIDRIDNTLTEDDIRTLSVEKIKDEDRLTNINTTLENEGKLTGKKVIIPYDIKLLVNGTPVTDNTYQNMLIKLSLPKEFYNAVFEIYHLSDDNTFGEQIEIHKQIYNNECLIFFEANSFSPYIPVSNLRTVLVRTNDDALGTVSPKGLSAVDVGTNKNITITPNQGYYANVLENGVKVKEKFRGTYTLNDIQDNKEIYVEFIKDEEPEKPTEPEKPSITNATVITIQTANHMPYINGYSDKTFRPNNAMTRAEFTKVISTISNNFNLSYDNDKYITKYKDVKEDSWYSNYVGYVTKLGLMKGYNDGTFKPNNYITRAEVSKVLSDMFNVPDKQIENIFFNELNGHWYFNSTNELIKGGVIKGYKDGTFKPNKNVTRAEVISLINRVKDREIDKDIDKGYLNMMDSKFKDVSKSNWFYNDLLEASIAHNSFDLH